MKDNNKQEKGEQKLTIGYIILAVISVAIFAALSFIAIASYLFSKRYTS